MAGILAAVAALTLSGGPMAEPVGIERVAWLAGCWEMSRDSRVVEERWTSPRGGSMLGTSRTIRDGALTGFEFVLLLEKDGALVYEAHPSGQAGASFQAREVAGTRVVFENAAHDFPQRIVYERRGSDVLVAWIEGAVGGKVRRVDFDYRRVTCP